MALWQTRHRRLGRTLSLALPLFGCRAAASAPTPAPAAGDAWVPWKPRIPVVRTELVPPDDTSEDSKPEPPQETHSAGPGRIGCGRATCSASSEVCCADTYRRHYACAKRGATPSPGLFEVDGGSLEIDEPVCVDARGDKMHHPELLFCDGSDDCPADEVCCKQAVGWTMCVRARGAPGRVCDLGEACSDGSCRTADARCDDGMCRTARPSVTCGRSACTPEAPICCEQEQERSCLGRAAAPSHAGFPVECRGAWNCLSGQRCCVSIGGFDASCAGSCGPSATPTCSTSADCRGVSVPGIEGVPMDAPICKFDRSLRVKRCAFRWE